LRDRAHVFDSFFIGQLEIHKWNLFVNKPFAKHRAGNLIFKMVKPKKPLFKTPKPTRVSARALKLAKASANKKKPGSKKEPTVESPETSSSSSSSSSSFMSVDETEKTPDNKENKGPEIKIKNKDEVSPKRSERKTGEPVDEILFEVFECEGEKFDGVLTRKDCKDLWKALGRDLWELRRLQRERVKGKCFKICYYLRDPITLTAISRRAEFEIEKVGSFGSTTYTVRLPAYSKIACKIGEIATISLKTSTIGIPDKVFLDWLKKFGKIIGNMRYESNKNSSS